MAEVRKRVRVAVAAVVVAAAGAGVAIGESLHHPPPASGSTVRLATAPVVRTDLVNTTQVSGSLGFAGSYSIANQLSGTAYTALPGAGQVVSQGQELYEVDGNPVFLFYGGRPEWRTLSAGVADGPDIAQLDRNLIALGYASAAELTVGDVFTGATAAAVDSWQTATGQPVTGAVELGQVAYAPGPIRIASTDVGLGSTPQPGTSVLATTDATPVVLAQLPVSQEYLVKAGDRVTVTLPDGTTTTQGTVTAVAAEATQASGGSSQQGNGQQGNGQQGNGQSQPTVQVTIQLSDPGAAGTLDQAPVTVNVVSARVADVLAVPVNALLARPNGSYAVAVMHGSASRLVAVQTGLFTSTLVQVTGAGLRPGELVQVPAP
jgi:Putative peptidoglycan binding domain